MGKSILLLCALALACNCSTAPAGPYPVRLLEVTQVETCTSDTLCKVFIAGETRAGVTLWSITGGWPRALPFSQSLASGYFNGISWMRIADGRAHIHVCASEQEPVASIGRDCAEYRLGF